MPIIEIHRPGSNIYDIKAHDLFVETVNFINKNPAPVVDILAFFTTIVDDFSRMAYEIAEDCVPNEGKTQMEKAFIAIILGKDVNEEDH